MLRPLSFGTFVSIVLMIILLSLGSEGKAQKHKHHPSYKSAKFGSRPGLTTASSPTLGPGLETNNGPFMSESSPHGSSVTFPLLGHSKPGYSIEEKYPEHYKRANFDLEGTLPILMSERSYKRSASATSTTSICPGGNGTSYTSANGRTYEIICNTNIVNNDLPFQLVGTFDACVSKCDSYNAIAGRTVCVAAIFLPNRILGSDDCYLKYNTNPQSSGHGNIEGAILVSSNMVATSSALQSSSTPSATSSLSISAVEGKQTATPTSEPAASAAFSVIYASGAAVIQPQISASQLHGPTQNQPSSQYIKWTTPPDITLMQTLLTVGVEGDLSVDYPLSLDTGVLPINSTTEALINDLSEVPHLSRDGGKGGYLNGQNLFVFCDTGSYTTTTSSSNGDFLGFVSSSVAIDIGSNALYGKAINLQDGIGQWADDSGRMRGFSPLTAGEMSYNLAMQGQGQRYALWPEASIIPLDAENAIMFTPIVYDNVNEETKAAVFTYTGAALLTIQAGSTGGPIAQRTVDRLFNQDEVEWGCIGGIRSWGPSGVGGTDGMVYLFGSVGGGLLLSRAPYDGIADRDSYEYWTGSSWSSGMLAPSSTAFFLTGPILDVDIFYSPRHLTFVAVYMTIYADSTFYYRYLQSEKAIIPPYAPGGDSTSDYVELLTQYDWSDEQVLYKAATGLSGKYIYSGGVHQAYFGTNDITNGGSKMLLSWTAPTGLDPSTLTSEYQIITAEIDWK
ncbi:hypothetical protein MMC25_002932 [Agyrium rufum]|nr:hypothetical protein [Agyrium rufum]